MAKASDGEKSKGVPEDVKAKFRDALERKNKGAGVDVSESQEHGKVDHAHGPAGQKMMFRRKSGG